MAVEFFAIGQLAKKAGGTTDQVEVKRSDADFDTEWRTLDSLTGGLTEAEATALIAQQTSGFAKTQDLADYASLDDLANTQSTFGTALNVKADLVNGKVPASQIPALPVPAHTHVVNDISDVADFAADLLTQNNAENARAVLGAMADDAAIPLTQVSGLADALARRPEVVEVASLAAYNALPVKTPGVLYIYPEA